MHHLTQRALWQHQRAVKWLRSDLVLCERISVYRTLMPAKDWIPRRFFSVAVVGHRLSVGRTDEEQNL